VASVQASDPFTYFVQVGAFRGADEAEAQRARLAMLGFDAKVSEREQAAGRCSAFAWGPTATRPTPNSSRNASRARAWKPRWCVCSPDAAWV